MPLLQDVRPAERGKANGKDSEAASIIHGSGNEAPPRYSSVTVVVTDHELVERARLGEAAAFEALVTRHHQAARRAAVAALGSADDADDVAQEAWIAVHARLTDFQGASSFRTWLLASVWNKALDRRRQVGRWLRRMVSLDTPWPSGDRGAALPAATAIGAAAAIGLSEDRPSPERRVLNDELSGQVARLVRALSAKLRDPLLLIGSGDYSYEEVAAMLGIPVGTVKWRVSEARRQLRAKLERLGH
jgi:RNA polymerase sigma-70 factor, ECF subfamily